MTHPLVAVLEAQERTPSWLARKTGYSVSLVHLVIHGKRTASPAFQSKAAEALRVPAHLLFPVDAP